MTGKIQDRSRGPTREVSEENIMIVQHTVGAGLATAHRGFVSTS